MIETELREGRLMRLADTILPDEFACYLVYPAASHAQPKIAAFRSWILEEPAHFLENVDCRTALPCGPPRGLSFR